MSGPIRPLTFFRAVPDKFAFWALLTCRLFANWAAVFTHVYKLLRSHVFKHLKSWGMMRNHQNVSDFVAIHILAILINERVFTKKFENRIVSIITVCGKVTQSLIPMILAIKLSSSIKKYFQACNTLIILGVIFSWLIRIKSHIWLKSKHTKEWIDRVELICELVCMSRKKSWGKLIKLPLCWIGLVIYFARNLFN